MCITGKSDKNSNQHFRTFIYRERNLITILIMFTKLNTNRLKLYQFLNKRSSYCYGYLSYAYRTDRCVAAELLSRSFYL